MRVEITDNKIEYKIGLYKNKTGATKKWIAQQLEMSPQRLHQLCTTDNMTVDVALRFAIFFECDVKDLFDYIIV